MRVITISFILLCTLFSNNCNQLYALYLKKKKFIHSFIHVAFQNSPEHWLQTNWHEKHMGFHTVWIGN